MCQYSSDCKDGYYCNPVVHDCQHCILICNPGKKEFRECTEHCPGYVMPQVNMVTTHGGPTTSTSSVMQSRQNQSDSYNDMMPLVPLAATLIAIMMVLILLTMAIILRYAYRSRKLGFIKQNLQKRYGKAWGMEKPEGSVECSAMMRSPIYKGKAKLGRGPCSPCVHSSAVKLKGQQPVVSVDPENPLLHKKKLTQCPGSLQVKLHKAEKSKLPASLMTVGQKQMRMTSNPGCSSMRSKHNFHIQDEVTNRRPLKELHNLNNSFASSTGQTRSSLPIIPGDQISLKNSQNSNIESSSQPVSWNTFHKEAEINDMQQEVCKVISFRNVSDTRNACNNEGPTQETHVKEYFSADVTQATTNGVQFTLDATPDVNPMGYEPARKQVTPHPNRVIYDILKGIDWVQGYYSEGQSIEVYADLRYISEEVAVKELTVRTGAHPDKFHLRQSDTSSYH